MPAWLRRITQAFGRARRPPEEHFAVECRCGEQHQGVRTEQPQQLICPVCESRVFIFPRSVYPPITSRSQPAGNKVTPPLHTVEVESIDQTLTAPGAPLGTRLKFGFRQLGRRCLEGIRSFFSPFRLVVLGTLLVISLTGWWVVYQSGQDQAERTYLEQVELAREALRKEDFAAAENPLTLAVAAAEVLDDPARGEAAIRQLHREVVVLNALQPLTLWAILQEGEDYLKTRGEEAWQKHFELHFSHGWMVLQTELFTSRTDDDQLLLELDLPVSLAGEPVKVQGFPAELGEFLEDRNSRAALIALQWKTCRHQGDSWILEPDPDAVFLWTGADTFDALGVELEEAERQRIQKLLQQQREFLNLE